MTKSTESETVKLETAYIDEIIQAAREKFPEITRIIVFGSRALKTSKPGSDIDLAIEGEKVTRGISLSFHDWLNHETSIPYKIDVVDISSITNNELLTHIKDLGVVIYEK